MRFNDRQLRTIENCLRVAAEKFKENAAAIRATHTGTAAAVKPMERLAEQFDRQQREAEQLAHVIGSAADRDPEVDYAAYPVPAGLRRRRGVEYGCGEADCTQCYEPINAAATPAANCECADCKIIAENGQQDEGQDELTPTQAGTERPERFGTD